MIDSGQTRQKINWNPSKNTSEVARVHKKLKVLLKNYFQTRIVVVRKYKLGAVCKALSATSKICTAYQIQPGELHM
jgi:hypothetical protein